jgi:hypothetical protein
MAQKPTQSSLEHAAANWRGALSRCARALLIRRASQGLALALCVVVLTSISAIGWMDAQRFAPLSIQAGQELAIAGAAASVLILIGALALRTSVNVLVTRIEAPSPELDGLLLSAAELDSSGSHRRVGTHSDGLCRRVYNNAARALERRTTWHARESRATRTALGMSAIPLIAGLALFNFGPPGLMHGLDLLFGVQVSATINPYSLEVKPGDVSVIEGEDLDIEAATFGYNPDHITLMLRESDSVAWRTMTMQSTGTDTVYVTSLLSLGRSFDYRIDADGVASKVHRVTVNVRPAVERIGLVYIFPQHTGAKPREVSDGGDIAAVHGTNVLVRVKAKGALDSAQLTFASGAHTPLIRDDDEWVGKITLSQDDSYRVDARSSGMDTTYAASREYAVRALSDGLPTVAVVRPGSDIKVSAIEEVNIDVDASDDVAVRNVELVVSVNGEAETVIEMDGASSRDSDAPDSKTVFRGTHQLVMETLELTPGDLIAYHVRVRDSTSTERSVSSDIFFLEIRPFERHYRRASASGVGQRGGGGGGGDAMLAAQQRAVVIALFKLVRDAKRLDAATLDERASTVEHAQTRIRERVDAITRRLKQRSLVNAEPGYQQIAEELPRASVAMVEVEAALGTPDAAVALPKARQALAHLQRADAAFREVRVSQARGGGTGGGRRQSDELANLFQLEMDRFKSQYSHVRRNRPGAERDAVVDEAMRKLEALAQRQEQELRRARSNATGEDTGAIAALAAEVNKLIRELERLTRNRKNEGLDEARRQLKQASAAMRRGGESGQARAKSQRTALYALRAAQRALDSAEPRALADAVRGANEDAKRFSKRHRQLEKETDGLQRDWDAKKTGQTRENAAQRANVLRATKEAKEQNQKLTQSLQEAIALTGYAKDETRTTVRNALQNVAERLRDANIAGELDRAAHATKNGRGAKTLAPGQSRVRAAIDAAKAELSSASKIAQGAGANPSEKARRRLAQSTRQLAEMRAGARSLSGNTSDKSRRTSGKRNGGQSSQNNANSGDRREGQEFQLNSSSNSSRQADGRGANQAPNGQGGSQGNSSANGEGDGQGNGRQSGPAQTASGEGRRSGQAQGQASNRAGGAAAPSGEARAGGGPGAGVATGGGRFGGSRGWRGNVSSVDVREGLRGSVDALRGALTGLAPSERNAKDISKLVAQLEGLEGGSEESLHRGFESAVTALQDIERRLRDVSGQDQPHGIAPLRQAPSSGEHRQLVRAYYESLVEDRRSTN